MKMQTNEQWLKALWDPWLKAGKHLLVPYEQDLCFNQKNHTNRSHIFTIEL